MTRENLNNRNLLFIDSSYSYSQITNLDLRQVLKNRSLGGYWKSVWSVHPVDTHPAIASNKEIYGLPIVEKVNETHYFVRGRYGRFKPLAIATPINSTLALLSLLFFLRKLVKTEKISTIRSGDPLLCGLIGLILKLLTGSKLVLRINADNDQIRLNTNKPIMPRMFQFRAFERMIESFVIKNSDAVIAPTNNYLELALKKGVHPSKCKIIRFGNLIDDRHLKPPISRDPIGDSDVLRKLSERPWMLHVGRLIEVKRVKDCFDVLVDLNQKGSTVGLCFIGDGPQRAELENLAINNNLNDRTWFLGNRDQHFLSTFIPHCSIVLSPLTGRALCEAAFAESAIIAYDNDWQGDLVKDGESGFLVKTGDTKKMAERAETLLNTPSLRTQFGRRARQIAIQLLSPDEQDRAEVDLYNSLHRYK